MFSDLVKHEICTAVQALYEEFSAEHMVFIHCPKNWETISFRRCGQLRYLFTTENEVVIYVAGTTICKSWKV